MWEICCFVRKAVGIINNSFIIVLQTTCQSFFFSSNFKQGVCSVQRAFYDGKLFEIMCAHGEDENTPKNASFYIFSLFLHLQDCTMSVRCLDQG